MLCCTVPIIQLNVPRQVKPGKTSAQALTGCYQLQIGKPQSARVAFLYSVNLDRRQKELQLLIEKRLGSKTDIFRLHATLEQTEKPKASSVVGQAIFTEELLNSVLTQLELDGPEVIMKREKALGQRQS